MADKLGYDKCCVYTQFFESCWNPEDGDKADVADIAIRMMRTGDKPRTIQKQERKTIGTIIVDPTDDRPFLDDEELTDPQLRWMRDRIRQGTKSRKQHEPKTSE